MYPATHAASSVSSLWYTVYFISFVLLGMFCLANLVVPILYKVGATISFTMRATVDGYYHGHLTGAL